MEESATWETTGRKKDRLMPNNDQNDKLIKALKLFDGVSETANGLLHPPIDLDAEKRGVLVCLGVGTVGVAFLSYTKAPWFAFVTEGCLVIIIAILVGRKRKR